MDVSLVGFIIVQVLSFAACYPNGAPTSSCADMMPRHTGVQPQPTPAPYTIQTNSTSFQTGIPITVVIKGPNYAGVLLEARSGSDATALGTWKTPPANTKFLQCSGNVQGAMTHANNITKDNTTVYIWTPPATANTVYFMATVAQQRSVYWLNVKSANLTPANVTSVNVTSSGGGGTSLNVHDSAESLKVIPALLLTVLLAHL